MTIRDPEATADEERFVLIGLSTRGRLVVVVHAELGGTIRLISARLAQPSERRAYEED
jgi:uncharacterized DUF497 family protein